MHLMVIDGNSLVNRAFYGVRPLTTKEGLPTNALFGFSKSEGAGLFPDVTEPPGAGRT